MRINLPQIATDLQFLKHWHSLTSNLAFMNIKIHYFALYPAVIVKEFNATFIFKIF